jgi:hypothetical protein
MTYEDIARTDSLEFIHSADDAGLSCLQRAFLDETAPPFDVADPEDSDWVHSGTVGFGLLGT